MALILTITLAIAAGYLAAVLLYLSLTFLVVTTAPYLVKSEGRFRPIYLLFSLALWLLCTAAGGYLSTWLTAGATAAWLPWMPVAVLAAALAAAAWLHPLETRVQLLGLTRPLMTLASLAGVVLGCYLRLYK